MTNNIRAGWQILLQLIVPCAPCASPPNNSQAAILLLATATMIKGTLWKSTPNYVGSMEKRFCVLVGTLILDFESADDFSAGAPPKAEGEVIGVSVWKGET